jgi:hypothetical protein
LICSCRIEQATHQSVVAASPDLVKYRLEMVLDGAAEDGHGGVDFGGFQCVDGYRQGMLGGRTVVDQG